MHALQQSCATFKSHSHTNTAKREEKVEFTNGWFHSASLTGQPCAAVQPSLLSHMIPELRNSQHPQPLFQFLSDQHPSLHHHPQSLLPVGSAGVQEAIPKSRHSRNHCPVRLAVWLHFKLQEALSLQQLFKSTKQPKNSEDNCK